MRKDKRVDNFESPENFRILYRKTFLGHAVALHRSISNSTRLLHKNKPEKLCTKEEFMEFIKRSKAFKNLYREWFLGGFQRADTPSVDRIDSGKGYCLSNIQIITLRENSMKGKGGRDPKENHLRQKKFEIIWALDVQGYTDAQIARMFDCHRSTIMRIMQQRPKDYTPKWIKVRE